MNFVVIVRGRLRATDPADAARAHQALFDQLSPRARALGNVGHLPFLGVADPRDIVVIDVWDTLAGAETLMGDPSLPAALATLFDGPPEVSMWRDAGWPAYLDRA
jgi:hypothetical protein